MKDARLYLVHILDCIERVERYTAHGADAFFADEMAQDATLRNLQLLAESCMRLSPAVRQRHAEINWRGIAGFRNAVVHEYLHMDLERVWDIIRRDVPSLATVIVSELATIEASLPPEEPEEGTP